MDFLKRTLIIGAHCDDIEAHAGGLAARLVEEGHEVHALVLSDSGSPLRRREASQGLRALGLVEERIRILQHPDRHFFTVLPQLIADIEQIIGELGIDTVVTHSSSDHHQDHQICHQACVAAGRKVRNLLLYRPTYPARAGAVPFLANFSVLLSETQLQRKLDAIRAHASQTHKYGNEEYLRFLGDQARVTAQQEAGVAGAAEVFQVLRLGWH